MKMFSASETSWLLQLLAFYSLLWTSYSETEEGSDAPLRIEPAKIKSPTERRVTFTCTAWANVTSARQWFSPNGTDINMINHTRITYDNNTGELVIDQVQIADGGTYMCITEDRQHNATAELQVFVMPSYFLEGMVLLAVNAVLVLTFILCFAYSSVHNWRMSRKDKQTAAMQKL